MQSLFRNNESADIYYNAPSEAIPTPVKFLPKPSLTHAVVRYIDCHKFGEEDFISTVERINDRNYFANGIAIKLNTTPIISNGKRSVIMFHHHEITVIVYAKHISYDLVSTFHFYERFLAIQKFNRICEVIGVNPPTLEFE